MKRIIRTVALLTVLGMTAVSCQKEPVVEPQGTVAEIGTVYTVRYAVDGVTHSTTLYGETAWQEFLNRMFALAEQGHRVSFVNKEASSSIVAAKREVVTFVTHNQQEAQSWAAAMYGQGFEVTVEYNPRTGLYTCTAVR